jgi:hypothetical protein
MTGAHASYEEPTPPPAGQPISPGQQQAEASTAEQSTTELRRAKRAPIRAIRSSSRLSGRPIRPASSRDSLRPECGNSQRRKNDCPVRRSAADRDFHRIGPPRSGVAAGSRAGRETGRAGERRPIDGQIVSAHNNGTSTRPSIPVQGREGQVNAHIRVPDAQPGRWGQQHADTAKEGGLQWHGSTGIRIR